MTGRHAHPHHAAGVHRLLAVIVATALFAACGNGSIGDDSSSAAFDPELRAVRLETTACGPASRRFGSGVAIASGLAITVAHLIVDAGSVEAFVAGGPGEPVEVAAVDLRRDLAVLRLNTDDMPEVESVIADSGAAGQVVGGAASGTVPFEVRRRVELTIEEILGTERHARLGYELAAATDDGDSGAGAYDEENRLIGIVFAAGKDGRTTWLTASGEIEDFLATVAPSDEYPLCQ